LSDDVVVGDRPCIGQLIDAYNTTHSSVVAVMEVPREETNRYGIINPDYDAETNDERLTKLKGVVEKPAPADAHSNLAVIGRYVLTPKVFEKLEQTQHGAGGEIQLTDAINALTAEQDVFAYAFEGRRYDAGTTMGWLKASIELALYFSDVLGIDDFWYRLSTRDEVKDKWAGSLEEWEAAQKALAAALDSLGQEYRLGPGEAAFYGPKIDFQVRDALRREFTNSTVQVDFQLPQKFDLEYVAEDGSRKRPVMVHRGAAGSMERLFAYLIERWAGAFPTWMAPVQVVVIPITDEQNAYAAKVAERLRQANLRVEVNDQSERMQKKIREAQRMKVPYMAIIGKREAEAGTVALRFRGSEKKQETISVDALIERLRAEIATRALHPADALQPLETGP